MEPDEILPIDPNQTLESALGISERRHTELTWIIDEMCIEGGTKADAVRKIGAMEDITDVEKVYVGYLLCKKFISTIPAGKFLSRWI